MHGSFHGKPCETPLISVVPASAVGESNMLQFERYQVVGENGNEETDGMRVFEHEGREHEHGRKCDMRVSWDGQSLTHPDHFHHLVYHQAVAGSEICHDTTIHVPRHDMSTHVSRMKTSHGADPQHQQTGSSSDHMGGKHSVDQFEPLASCNGRPLSYERRDTRAENGAPAESMGAPGGGNCQHLDCPKESIPDAGSGGDEHQGQSCQRDEAAGPPRTSGGIVPASSIADHPPVQSVRRLERMWEVQCPTEVPVQEASNLHTKGEGGFDEGIRPTGANVSTSGEAFIHSKQGIPREFSPSERVGSNTPGSPAELSASELAVGSGDHAGELLAQRTFSGPVSDDHDDGTGFESSSRPGCPRRTSRVRHEHARVGGSGDCGGGRSTRSCLPEPGQPKRAHVKLNWPAWMLALGVTTSSNILTWQHCSSDFREILNAHGVTDEYYMFQYDLGQGSLDDAFQSHPIRLCPKEFLGGQECQDPCVLADCAECQGPNECQGDSECPETALPHRSLDCLQEVDVELNQELRAFPSWLPEFVQSKERHLPRASSLEEDSFDGWCTIWRRVVDLQTLEVLEDSPGPHQPLDFHRPLDLWVCWWGLPLDFVALSSFSSNASDPVQIPLPGEEGQPGRIIWAFHTDQIDHESINIDSEGRGEVGAESDLKRCANNFMTMSKQRNTGGAQQVDFVELFSPPRVAPPTVPEAEATSYDDGITRVQGFFPAHGVEQEQDEARGSSSSPT